MNPDPRIPDLVHRWREARRQGLEIQVDELCRGCPELTEEVGRLISLEGETHNLNVIDHTVHETDRPELGGQLGGFRLVREIGRGGMGVVYEAEDPSLHRRVAIKVLRAGQDDGVYRERFLREARSAAGVRHDHVITIHQVGQEGDRPFLVMELLEGESLADRLKRQTCLPVAEAVRIAREVCEGLAAAHAKGLIHRDVKPGNIWLEKPNGRVKLLDFGLARTVEGSSLTAEGVVAGSLGYMAPEQIYAGALDGRTDLYAVGCVLYQMLWGQMPFQQEHTMALLEAVISQDAPNLDAVARTLPAPLAVLLRSLLARNPADRPATAAAAAQALGEIEASLTPGGKRPAQVQSPPENRRTRPWGIWAGATIIGLTVVIGIVTLIGRFAGLGSADPVAQGVPIRVGVLHSLSGPNKDSEKPMYEALLLAADELNAAGGVLGRPIELIHHDPGSTNEDYARLAEQLITEDRVEVIFGCWSSASRKLVGEVAARHQSLLVYSSLTEGLEQHPNVVYVGGAPNQQLHEAANWNVTLPELRRRKPFLVGTDYDIYPYAAHEILKKELESLGVKVVGDAYVRDASDFEKVAKQIAATGADVIFNTVDGPSISNFSDALRHQGLTPKTVPTIWLGVGEDEIGALVLRDIEGDFAVNPYFESIPSADNQAFVKRFKYQFPARTRISDATEASYCAMYLWKQAVAQSGSPDPMQVREAFRGQSFVGPEGEIRIDPVNLYAWRRSRIARLQNVPDAKPPYRFEILKGTEALIRPEPFPAAKSRDEWETFLNAQRDRWGGHWSPRRDKGKSP